MRRQLRQAERRLQDEEDRPGEDANASTITASGSETTTSRRAALTRSPELVLSLQRMKHSGERLALLRSEAARLQSGYDACLQDINKLDPEFDPDRPVPPVSLNTIRSLIPTDVPTAVVQYTLTRKRGIALIVTRDDLLAVTLPELNERQAFELAIAWFENYYRLRQAARGGDLGGVPQLTWDDALPALLEPAAARAGGRIRPALPRSSSFRLPGPLGALRRHRTLLSPLARLRSAPKSHRSSPHAMRLEQFKLKWQTGALMYCTGK